MVHASLDQFLRSCTNIGNCPSKTRAQAAPAFIGDLAMSLFQLHHVIQATCLKALTKKEGGKYLSVSFLLQKRWMHSVLGWQETGISDTRFYSEIKQDWDRWLCLDPHWISMNGVGTIMENCRLAQVERIFLRRAIARTKNLIAIKSESRGANSLPSKLLNNSASTLDA